MVATPESQAPVVSKSIADTHGEPVETTSSIPEEIQKAQAESSPVLTPSNAYSTFVGQRQRMEEEISQFETQMAEELREVEKKWAAHITPMRSALAQYDEDLTGLHQSIQQLVSQSEEKKED